MARADQKGSHASQERTTGQELRVLIETLGGWTGFDIAGVELEETPEPDVWGIPSTRLVIELRARPGAPKCCSRCGEIVLEVHDVTMRRVRDLPLLGRDTWLLVPSARMQCPRCGPTDEAVSWLDRDQRMTTRLAAKIAQIRGSNSNRGSQDNPAAAAATPSRGTRS